MTSPSGALVVFGITGDLASKQIFPALQAMIKHGHLDVPIVGVALDGNLDQLRTRARDSLDKHGGVDEKAFAQLSANLRYVAGDYQDPATFDHLRKALGDAARPLHYLAVPPPLFATVAAGLSKSGCATDARVVCEKPFGHDLASARPSTARCTSRSPSRAFSASITTSAKNRCRTFSTSASPTPSSSRSGTATTSRACRSPWPKLSASPVREQFYEGTGAIRDVVQNHLLQVTAILASEAPADHDAESSRDEKTRIFKAMRTLAPSNIVRGQFAGYRDEHGVAADSSVETFAAVRLAIDTWRWAGVPFCLRTGKCLPVTVTEVMVTLKRPPQAVFGEIEPHGSNYFRFRLGPNVVIALGTRAKVPGEAMLGEEVELIARHQDADEMAPYERLLGDAMRGDASLFAREDGVEEAWRVVDPILGNVTPVHDYEPNTWGPPEADALVTAEGGWHNPQERATRQ